MSLRGCTIVRELFGSSHSSNPLGGTFGALLGQDWVRVRGVFGGWGLLRVGNLGGAGPLYYICNYLFYLIL